METEGIRVFDAVFPGLLQNQPTENKPGKSVRVNVARCQLPVWDKQTRAYLLQGGNRQNQTLCRLLKSSPNLVQSTHCSEIKTTKLITG